MDGTEQGSSSDVIDDSRANYERIDTNKIQPAMCDSFA